MTTNFLILSIGTFRILIAVLFSLSVERPNEKNSARANKQERVLRIMLVGLTTYTILAAIEFAIRSVDYTEVYPSTFWLWLAAVGCTAVIFGIAGILTSWEQVSKIKIVLGIMLLFTCRQLLSDINRGLDFGSTNYIERKVSHRNRLAIYHKGSFVQDYLDFGGEYQTDSYLLPGRMKVASRLSGSVMVGIEVSPGFLGWPWYRSVERGIEAQLRRSPTPSAPLSQASVKDLHAQCLELNLRHACELLMNSADELHLEVQQLHAYEEKACEKGFLHACEKLKERQEVEASRQRNEIVRRKEEQTRLRERELRANPDLRKAIIDERIARERAQGIDSLLSVQEAADYIGVSRRYIHDRARARQFGDYGYSHYDGIRLSDLERFRKENQANLPKEPFRDTE